ncbi:Zinc finger, C3HC4 type (RING finger) [Musa troglodytarum]|uniref:Zinc finger, C3HC4 type (RING finger) n=1 Tax=Musa troglodytarum TaxID=320322 RepID=A0A9E7L298_9LILI|nr:Zinc finger, C3HC4 type (RING finger) [Musa troglodytarum]
MEKGEESGAGNKPATDEDSPIPSATPTVPPPPGDAAPAAEAPAPPARAPFTSLSQIDADLALVRILQEQVPDHPISSSCFPMLNWIFVLLLGMWGFSQRSFVVGDWVQETAYAMLMMDGDGSDYWSSDYDEEGAGDEVDRVAEGGVSIEGSDYEVDATNFENDEAYARALQDAEERELAVRLMALAGLNEYDYGDHRSGSQDAWQDPDEFMYEELVALGEVVGTESRGLSSDTISALPSVSYKAENVQDDNAEQCIICRLEFEDGDSLVLLSCKHKYHPDCINKWLQINKACPMCNTEVSTSENKQD